MILLLVTLYVGAADKPADVAGKWTVPSPAMPGSGEQALDWKQAGNRVTGMFTGPRQSGTVEGTVEHVVQDNLQNSYQLISDKQL